MEVGSIGIRCPESNMFKASKALFLTLRVATPSGAPRQAHANKIRKRRSGFSCGLLKESLQHLKFKIAVLAYCCLSKCLMCYISFSVLKSFTCGRQSRCPGWTYELLGGQKFSFKLSSLSVGFPLKFNKKDRSVQKLPPGCDS